MFILASRGVFADEYTISVRFVAEEANYAHILTYDCWVDTL